MSPFLAVIARDVRLALRQGGGSYWTLLFFVLTVTLFPLGVGPDLALLARIGPGVLWVVALLAAMLSLDRMFQADYEDGSLELLALAPLPLELTVLAKAAAHWLTTGLPVTLLAPALGFLLAVDVTAYPILIAAMLLGTPVLSLVGSIGAALTVGVRRGGVLLSLLVIPLYVPALIFGALAVEATLDGLSPRPHLLLLGADLLVALALTPWAAAAALRLNLE
ncbi:MAG: heme exporter protein CcmB [Alphaproteobacteria bacterium]|nr:heme exporter protein CcmB [Alphaproteobacteria bacterium]